METKEQIRYGNKIPFTALFGEDDFIRGSLEDVRKLQERYGWEFTEQLDYFDEQPKKIQDEYVFYFFFKGTADINDPQNDTSPHNPEMNYWLDWSGYEIDSNDHAQAWVELLEVCGVEWLTRGSY